VLRLCARGAALDAAEAADACAPVGVAEAADAFAPGDVAEKV
jgi:hypothetical protein